MSDIYFCTFADSRYAPSLKRINQQAKKFDVFKKIYAYDEHSLDISFKVKNKNKLILGSRGYGYWIWKPNLIKKILSEIKENDILLYTDVGCYLNSKGIKRFYDYVDMISDSTLGILANEINHNEYIERKYTKGDLLDYFNVRNNKKITDTYQIQSGFILIRKNKISEELVLRWCNVYEDNFSLVDDSQSLSKNFPDFIEHRHDQSIFSILFKMYGGIAVSLEEVQVNKSGDIHDLDAYPIWYIRKKSKTIFYKVLSVLIKLKKKIFDIF